MGRQSEGARAIDEIAMLMSDDPIDPSVIDPEAALGIALKVPKEALIDAMRRLADGDESALRGYPRGTTAETIRYVLENRTIVDAGAYANGVANGIDEVAMELGMPFHGAMGDHYSIAQIKSFVEELATPAAKQDCPAAEIAGLRDTLVPDRLGRSHATWKAR